ASDQIEQRISESMFVNRLVQKRSVFEPGNQCRSAILVFRATGLGDGQRQKVSIGLAVGVLDVHHGHRSRLARQRNDFGHPQCAYVSGLSTEPPPRLHIPQKRLSENAALSIGEELRPCLRRDQRKLLARYFRFHALTLQAEPVERVRSE